MRIGILTYHCPPNFGAQLQAISTVGYLKKAGHEPIVLNWYPQDLENMYGRRIPAEQAACHKDFTQEVLPVTEILRTEEQLANKIDSLNLDGIVVGSDALFKYQPLSKRSHFSLKKLRIVKSNPLSVEDLPGNPFFGGFVSMLKKRIPVCAFSVSSQNCPYDDMNEEETQTMGSKLNNYSLITVRDEWTKKMVEHVSKHSNVGITPDPVFSFNNNCYLEMPQKEEVLSRFGIPNNYVLISFWDHNINNEYIAKLAKSVRDRGLVPVALPMPENLYSFGIENVINLPLTPFDWYCLIKYSQGYIGERMHPIVSCLHNAVPFFSFDEYGVTKKNKFTRRISVNTKSSKTYLILKEAGLLSNYYSYFNQESLPSTESVVDKIVSFDRDKCLQFSQKKRSEYAANMEAVLNCIKNNQ